MLDCLYEWLNDTCIKWFECLSQKAPYRNIALSLDLQLKDYTVIYMNFSPFIFKIVIISDALPCDLSRSSVSSEIQCDENKCE